MDSNPMYSNAFALAGRISSFHHTQGDALGYVLVSPSGRTLNARFPFGACLERLRLFSDSSPLLAHAYIYYNV